MSSCEQPEAVNKPILILALFNINVRVLHTADRSTVRWIIYLF